jgi:NAD(P)-dependent dehydrogenase (short-subunit alcohol dehydrogenase family)
MKVALITGASRGLGQALAARLAADGWALVLDARGADDLAATAAAMRRTGAVVHALPGDVTSPGHRAELVAAAGELGGIDLLVNNASTLGPSPLPALADLPLDALESVLRVNVVAPLGLIQQALPVLRPGATIVNVTSDAAVEGYAGWGGYGASKAALDQVSNVLGVERPDLHVYAFDPGDMRTRMHQDAFPGEDISDRPEPATVVPALLQLVTSSPPSGRYRATDLATEPVTAAGAGAGR